MVVMVTIEMTVSTETSVLRLAVVQWILGLCVAVPHERSPAVVEVVVAMPSSPIHGGQPHASLGGGEGEGAHVLPVNGGVGGGAGVRLGHHEALSIAPCPVFLHDLGQGYSRLR